MKNNKIDKQEMIELLKQNGIEPDNKCFKEDLEALIEYENILINREGGYSCAEWEPMHTPAKNKLLFEIKVLEERIKDLRKEIENA